MAWFKTALDAFVICVLLPIGLLMMGSIALAVGVQPLLIYVGALLAVWLLLAIGFPMVGRRGHARGSSGNVSAVTTCVSVGP